MLKKYYAIREEVDYEENFDREYSDNYEYLWIGGNSDETLPQKDAYVVRSIDRAIGGMYEEIEKVFDDDELDENERAKKIKDIFNDYIPKSNKSDFTPAEIKKLFKICYKHNSNKDEDVLQAVCDALSIWSGHPYTLKKFSSKSAPASLSIWQWFIYPSSMSQSEAEKMAIMWFGDYEIWQVSYYPITKEEFDEDSFLENIPTEEVLTYETSDQNIKKDIIKWLQKIKTMNGENFNPITTDDIVLVK